MEVIYIRDNIGHTCRCPYLLKHWSIAIKKETSPWPKHTTSGKRFRASQTATAGSEWCIQITAASY